MCKEVKIVNLLTGEELDESINLADNSILKINPKLFVYWDFAKNNEIGLDIYNVTKGMHKKAWWICGDCKSNYDMKIFDKTRGRGCPYCTKKRVNETNSLASLRSDIASQWHSSKNGTLTPDTVVCGSHQKVWWECNEGHEWCTTIESRTKINGTNCPFCESNCNQLLLGFNDMWTTNSELASLLANPEDGYKYMQSSGKKVDWKCPDCGEIVRKKSPNNVRKQGVNCAICKDNMSLGEKMLYSILINGNYNFIYNEGFKWSKNKRYDFYLPEYNLIIETHGLQHYEESPRGRSLKQEQDNDNFKQELALKNGIKNYIIIDCRYSDYEYIKSNLLNSKLVTFLKIDDTTFKNLQIKQSSLVLEAWELWNNGKSIIEIGKILRLGRNTVSRYLKLGNSLGKCNYNSNSSKDRTKKAVVKIDFKGNVIVKFESIKQAEIFSNKRISITKHPFKINRKANDHIWVYEKDYLNHNNELIDVIRRYNLKNNICQLDVNMNLLKIYDNLSEASRENNFEFTNLYATCNGKHITAYGFKWMYLSSYNEFIKKQNKEITG